MKQELFSCLTDFAERGEKEDEMNPSIKIGRITIKPYTRGVMMLQK